MRDPWPLAALITAALLIAVGAGFAGGYTAARIAPPPPTVQQQETVLGCYKYTIPNSSATNRVICLEDRR